MRLPLTVSALILVSLACCASSAQSPGRKTVWDGVYTAAQAARGKEAYTENCSKCHGDTLAGTANNALQGTDFMDRWREDNVESLFLFIQTSMPPSRNRAIPRVPLDDKIYLDVISYVMQANSFPPGTDELKAAATPGIQIEGRDGPRPLPSGALAVVVGCMTQAGTGWTLTHSTDPIRTRSSEVTPVEELKMLQDKPSSQYTFRLANFGYIGGDFKPEQHAGEKMVAKGTLVRQLGAERINLTSMTTLAPSCRN
jgi:mono/diheme cytochrome c family protein